MPLWNIAKANEYLVMTGAFVNDIRIVKKGWCLPGQRVQKFDMTPVNYTLSLQAMSAEKLEFTLPAVFTIGPKDEMPCLIKYAHLLADRNKDDHVHELVKGVIEGETRVIAAAMTMEEIFKERKYFKENVIKNVQAELDQFGLFIYNANVKQLQDTPGSEYFTYLRLKTHEGAVNQAKVDVAEAKYKGDVGERERQNQTTKDVTRIEADTRKETARINAETVIFEQERKNQVAAATANLAKQQADYDRSVAIAKIEAENAAKLRNTEMQQQIEKQRITLEEQRLTAEQVTKAKAEYESSKHVADSKLYARQREAEAAFYTKQKEAEASYLVKAKEADAELYEKQKQAEGVAALAIGMTKMAEGVKSLSEAFGRDNRVMLQYLMMENGLFATMAAKNAEAIKGLNPKITVWSTGSGDGNDSSKPIRDIFQTLPPLFSTIEEQTGITPPAWLSGGRQTIEKNK